MIVHIHKAVREASITLSQLLAMLNGTPLTSTGVTPQSGVPDVRLFVSRVPGKQTFDGGWESPCHWTINQFLWVKDVQHFVSPDTFIHWWVLH